MNRKNLIVVLSIISLAALTVTTALARGVNSQHVTKEDALSQAVTQSHSPSKLSMADRIRFQDMEDALSQSVSQSHLPSKLSMADRIHFQDRVLDDARIRAATARYKRLEVATDAGYALLPGLDHCFNKPGVGAMGYHYIQAASLDLNLDLEKPEALVYAPGPEGQLLLAAVEYIVPAEPWDKDNPGKLPVLIGRSLHLNEELGVYVLHAWVWKNNPQGMYEDWNPKVTCP